MTKRFGFTLAEGATHVDMFKGSCKSAFTLAEVLITLGIIGVVAAMTMPTLMNSTNGAQYKTAYKKALSVLSQAVVL
ncbi:MAG: type II secretion system protein, partial [Brachyspira sp.]|nr:type II secretion system protein [Brachyspira sp.]